MPDNELINVLLDKDLIQRLLNGLHTGASGKALKVVIDTDKRYHVESKELRMVIEIDGQRKSMISIDIHNGKQSARITSQELQEMRLKGLADEVVAELTDKYSPVFHSLADNIVVFSRAYGNPSIDR